MPRSKVPEGEQSDLFETRRRAERLREALDGVRDRMGEASLVPAATLRHGRSLSHVPFGSISSRRLPRGA